MSETTGFVLFILGIFACGPIVLLIGRWLERRLKPESAERAEFISGWNKAKTEHSGAAALQESLDV